MNIITLIWKSFLWFLLGGVVAPVVFAICDEFYSALVSNKSLALQLDPVVIAIIGNYDTLSWPLPLYFLISVAGGMLSVFIGVFRFFRVSKDVL